MLSFRYHFMYSPLSRCSPACRQTHSTQIRHGEAPGFTGTAGRAAASDSTCRCCLHQHPPARMCAHTRFPSHAPDPLLPPRCCCRYMNAYYADQCPSGCQMRQPPLVLAQRPSTLVAAATPLTRHLSCHCPCQLEGWAVPGCCHCCHPCHPAPAAWTLAVPLPAAAAPRRLHPAAGRCWPRSRPGVPAPARACCAWHLPASVPAAWTSARPCQRWLRCSHWHPRCRWHSFGAAPLAEAHPHLHHACWVQQHRAWARSNFHSDRTAACPLSSADPSAPQPSPQPRLPQ
mmetsp:Transcript_34208/g.86535  ORF Transcript_34208/g.86535 Transcript_34208/m.86535 type:complete len:287 (-) Transcript_34208:41-901(-)